MMRGSAPAVRSLIYSEICPMPTSRTGNWPAILAILLIKVISLFVLLVVWLGGEIQRIIFYLGWAATRTTACSFLLGVIRVILWFLTKTYSLCSPTFHEFEFEVKIYFFFKFDTWSDFWIPEEEIFFFFCTQLNYMLEFFDRRRKFFFLLLQWVI